MLRSLARDRSTPQAGRPERELPFWDAELTAAAADLLAFRVGAIQALSARARRYFELLTGDTSLAITYASPRMDLPETLSAIEDWRAPTQTLRQSLSAAFSRSLSAHAAEELRRGITVVGPHRDDFSFPQMEPTLPVRIAGPAATCRRRDEIGRAGSPGRCGGEPPVLLLDDVLSELDVAHRSTDRRHDRGSEAQVCVTATDESDLASPQLAHLPVLRTSGGVVKESMRIQRMRNGPPAGRMAPGQIVRHAS